MGENGKCMDKKKKGKMKKESGPARLPSIMNWEKGTARFEVSLEPVVVDSKIF